MVTVSPFSFPLSRAPFLFGRLQETQVLDDVIILGGVRVFGGFGVLGGLLRLDESGNNHGGHHANPKAPPTITVCALWGPLALPSHPSGPLTPTL